MITLRINLLRIFNWIMTSMLGAGWVFIIYEENNVKLSMLNINKKSFQILSGDYYGWGRGQIYHKAIRALLYWITPRPS